MPFPFRYSLNPIIDTAQKWLRLDDLNDYAKVTAAMQPYANIAQASGASIGWTHHAGKAERDSVGDSSIGSTAMLGGVDCLIEIKRRGQLRTASSGR